MKLYVKLFQRCGEEYMERIFELVNSTGWKFGGFCEEDKGKLRITEICRAISKQCGGAWRVWYYGEQYGAYGRSQRFWDRKGNSVVNVLPKKHILYDNLDELELTQAERSCARIMDGLADPAEIICAVRYHEGLERLIKAGLKRLAREIIQETAGNFVYIGYRLKQIRDSGMYDGCDSVYEFAEKEYGLSRSTVSRFMAVNDKFSKHGNSIELRDEFVGLNQSQLTEMLTLPVSDYEMVTEETSIKEIRELKAFEKDAMNPPEDESGIEEPKNGSTMQVAENPNSGNEVENGIKEPEEVTPAAAEAVATSQIREFTPLQKCIIDFFRDKLDLLEEVEKAYTIKDAAELMAPNGCTTHRKGIIFLTMQNYDKGIKYKQMGVPLPISMTWDKFFNEIRTVFFDFEENYKERLKEIYPESVPKVAESVQKEPENVQRTAKTDIKPQKTEKIAKEPERPAAEEPVATSQPEEKGKEDTVEEEHEEEASPAAEDDDELPKNIGLDKNTIRGYKAGLTADVHVLERMIKENRFKAMRTKLQGMLQIVGRIIENEDGTEDDDEQ